MKLFRTLPVAICLAIAALALTQGKASAGLAGFSLPFGANSANSSSFLLGGHAGYNWQQGQAVYGFETDLQAVHLNSVMTDNLMFAPPGGVPAPNSFAQTSATINWYGTLRGRIGWAQGPWLLYGTGGLAYGEVGLSSAFGTLGVATQLQLTDDRVGWVAGVGAEYLVRPDLSVGISYQYVDLGTLSGASTATFAGLTVSQAASTHAQFQAVMAGLSWRFAAEPTAGPWAGGYAGAHIGGAWGNDASALYSSSRLFAPPPP
jgi:outer membrane immunogenic protein